MLSQTETQINSKHDKKYNTTCVFNNMLALAEDAFSLCFPGTQYVNFVFPQSV